MVGKNSYEGPQIVFTLENPSRPVLSFSAGSDLLKI